MKMKKSQINISREAMIDFCKKKSVESMPVMVS